MSIHLDCFKSINDDDHIEAESDAAFFGRDFSQDLLLNNGLTDGVGLLTELTDGSRCEGQDGVHSIFEPDHEGTVNGFLPYPPPNMQDASGSDSPGSSSCSNQNLIEGTGEVPCELYSISCPPSPARLDEQYITFDDNDHFENSLSSCVPMQVVTGMSDSMYNAHPAKLKNYVTTKPMSKRDRSSASVESNQSSSSSGSGLGMTNDDIKSLSTLSIPVSPQMTQALKRQIRMIRNRESASLSRKRKKEYLSGLERKVMTLEEENLKLKQENQILKWKLNQNNVRKNSAKPVALSEDIKPFGQAGRKRTAFLAKMALLSIFGFFMLNIHVPGSRHRSELNNLSYAHLRNDSGISSQSKVISMSSDSVKMPWNDMVQGEKLTNSTYTERFSLEDNMTHSNFVKETDDPSKRSSNRTVKTSYNFLSEPSFFLPKSVNSSNVLPKCNPSSPYLNATENLKVQRKLKGLFMLAKPIKRKRHQMDRAASRKYFVFTPTTLGDRNIVDESGNGNKELTVYRRLPQGPRSDVRNLLQKLDRKEDTFYVVSLGVENQLLLSAKFSNSSSRPKMSFLMPWKNDTHGGKEEFMQIDCEVTKVFSVNRK